MGVRNYLIDGMSGTGKTTVAKEIQRRGYHVIHGDRELAYRGDPKTEEHLNEPVCDSEQERILWLYRNYVWNTEKVESLIKDHTAPITFFCGGSRNSPNFIDLFDGVFILEVADPDLIYRRLDELLRETQPIGVEGQKRRN